MNAPFRLEKLLADLKAENALLTEAVEALEAEIVGERAKALDAQREAAEATKRAERLAEELRWSEATVKDLTEGAEAYDREVRDLRSRLEKAETEADDLREQLEQAEGDLKAANEELAENEASEALADFLVAKGYPSRPLRVDDRDLQQLIDRVLN